MPADAAILSDIPFFMVVSLEAMLDWRRG